MNDERRGRVLESFLEAHAREADGLAREHKALVIEIVADLPKIKIKIKIKMGY